MTKRKRSWCLALAAPTALMFALFTGPAAMAAAGDGVDFSNGSWDVNFHTKDCKASGYFRYVAFPNDMPGNGGAMLAFTEKLSGPSWCRVGFGMTYRKGGRSGPLVTIPLHWGNGTGDKNNPQWEDVGYMCSTTHAIQRPGAGYYVVHLYPPPGDRC